MTTDRRQNINELVQAHDTNEKARQLLMNRVHYGEYEKPSTPPYYMRQFSLNDIRRSDDQVDQLRREMEGRKYLKLEQKGIGYLAKNPRFS